MPFAPSFHRSITVARNAFLHGTNDLLKEFRRFDFHARDSNHAYGSSCTGYKNCFYFFQSHLVFAMLFQRMLLIPLPHGLRPIGRCTSFDSVLLRTQNPIRYLVLNVSKKLKKLPIEIGNLVSLVDLDLSFSKVTSLPPSIGQMQALRFRGLTRSSSLPPSIWQLQSLQELNLFASSMRNIPDDIGNLNNLIKLNLSSSDIESLPPSIGRLQALQQLDLDGTMELTSLPEEIGDLHRLIKLDLRKSGVTSLPSSIEKLDGLRFLHIMGSCIRELSGSQDDRDDFISSLVQRCTSLGHIDEELLTIQIEYALACNRARSRRARSPIGSQIISVDWSIMLANATCAVKAYSNNGDFRPPKGLEPTDAIFRVLADGRESFVRMLVARKMVSQQKKYSFT